MEQTSSEITLTKGERSKSLTLKEMVEDPDEEFFKTESSEILHGFVRKGTPKGEGGKLFKKHL